MRASKYFRSVVLLLVFLVGTSSAALAQFGSAGSIRGTVVDQTGGVVPDAVVEIHNPISGYRQTTKTDASGEFLFLNIPRNPYHLSVSKEGFQIASQDVDVRSSVPVELKIALRLKGASETVTVEAGSADLLENTPTAHTDVDRNLFSKMPLESVSSSISSLITFTTPGVAADSNGFMHGLGEHQESQFAVDGQAITDQQSKAFSNQIPVDAVQSLEAVNGIPPAEYGDKTTLIINVTTRSGLNLRPTGKVTASYGSFGTSNTAFDFAVGSQRWGNFITASGLQSGRFLDPPEFTVIHAKGNSENIFDRLDFRPRTQDSLHVNLNYARSWFQQPNQFDQAAIRQDQRALINTFNIAPAWTHIFNAATILTASAFVRQDRYHYFPRAGRLLNFDNHTDVKETSLYVQDAITFRNWSFSLGIRGDLYRGLSSASVAEPRLAVAYNFKKTSTVLRLGYARAIVTPYNENLLVSSSTGLGGLGGPGGGAIPPKPGYRNLFNAGLEQAFGKYLVVTADYYWKYTKPDYDFGVLFSTPLTFPIQWKKSKIDGVAARVSVPNFHGLALVTVLGTSRDRFFPPGVGGLIFNTPPPPGVFRIDHDQAFQQTTHVQYQWKSTGPWVGFNWRYDSGLVAGAVPFATDTTTPIDLTVLTPDQQIQAGLFCGNVFPTLTTPLTNCAPSQYGSTRINIPAPGTQNDDRNPARIKPRHLFDVAAGVDDLFRGDRYRWSLRFTVINLTNKVALYNFLSTFSGTHFVTPRTYTGELGFHF